MYLGHGIEERPLSRPPTLVRPPPQRTGHTNMPRVPFFRGARDI